MGAAGGAGAARALGASAAFCAVHAAPLRVGVNSDVTIGLVQWQRHKVRNKGEPGKRAWAAGLPSWPRSGRCGVQGRGATYGAND